MNDFKDLIIWKLSFSLSFKIYELTIDFPEEEKYGLTSQIRRASVSIFSNIAEGFGRGTTKDFRNFLYNARGSLREVEAQLLMCKKLKYVSNEEFNKIYSEIRSLGIHLVKFIQKMKV